MLAPQFENQLKEGRARKSILEQVKWVLRRLLSGSRPDLLMIAKELGMSERTLQRRITEEGTTFRQLLNETRHELVRNTSATRRSRSPKRHFSSVMRIRIRSTARSDRGRAKRPPNGVPRINVANPNGAEASAHSPPLVWFPALTHRIR